jgi:hypothetical protein
MHTKNRIRYLMKPNRHPETNEFGGEFWDRPDQSFLFCRKMAGC